MNDFLNSKFDRITHYKLHNVKTLKGELDLLTSMLNSFVENVDSLGDASPQITLLTQKSMKLMAIHRSILGKLKAAVSRSVLAPASRWIRAALVEQDVRDIDGIMAEVNATLEGQYDAVEPPPQAGESTYSSPLLKQPNSTQTARYHVGVLRATLEQLVSRVKTPQDLMLVYKPITECIDRIALCVEMVHKFEVVDKIVMEKEDGERIIGQVFDVVEKGLAYLRDDYQSRAFNMTCERIQFTLDTYLWEHCDREGPQPDWDFDGSDGDWDGRRTYQMGHGPDCRFYYYGTKYADDIGLYANMLQGWLQQRDDEDKQELLDLFVFDGKKGQRKHITRRAVEAVYPLWKNHQEASCK